MPDLHPFGGRMSRHFLKSPTPDAYLSYYDVRLNKEDIQVLKDEWLNDNIIAFWEEYLEREYLTSYRHSSIVLLRPTMSFMLIMTPDPTTIKEALPNLTNVSHVFVPINDAHRPDDAEGGSHWSLLLVSIIDGVAFHYDSLPPGNQQEAWNTTRKLEKLLNKALRFIQLKDSPAQENLSDCGVFVCLNMRHLLLKRLLMVRTDEKVSMSMGGRKIDAREGRKEMLKIINAFRKEGERRRSISASPYPGGKSRSPPRIDSPMKPEKIPDDPQ